MDSKSSKSSSSSSAKKTVTFGTNITIREHPIIMGDNPACDGCPITIDWEPIGTQTRNLELYEYTRMETRKRNKKKLTIPVQARSKMLLEMGYTHKQIVDRALEINEIKKRRAESATSSGNELKKMIGMDGFQKLSKNFLQKGFANLGIGPKVQQPPTKTTVTARTA